MGKRTGIYLRISDDREGRELGVGRQEEDTRAKATAAGDEVVHVYKDNDISASTRSTKPRPAYTRMLADARAGRIQKIIAYTSGRLTRRPREHEDQIELAERFGVEFDYVASPSFDLNTSAGRRIARILAANDAGESEDISERARRAKLQAAREGQWRGGRRPFGYEADGVTLRQDEAGILLGMADHILAGGSLHGLAAELNAMDVRTTMNAKWTSVSVRDVLMRPRNAGKVEHHGEIVADAVWPKILEEDVWAGLCAMFTEPDRNNSSSWARKWLGAGLYLCGRCADGTTMRSGATRVGRHTSQPAYRCRRRAHLGRLSAPVDELVERVVVARLSRPDAVELLRVSPEVDAVALRTEKHSLRERLKELDDDRDAGRIDRARWLRRNAAMAERIVAIETELAAAVEESVLTGVAGNPDLARLWFGSRPDRSDGLSLARRAAVVGAVATVTVLPAPRGRRPGGGYFSPEFIRIEPKEPR